MKRIFLLLVFLSFGACAHHYDTVLHKIGNATYMIRWARQAGAAKYAPDSYGEALSLQKKAQAEHKKHSLIKADALAVQAYDAAKQAKDQALAATGKKF